MRGSVTRADSVWPEGVARPVIRRRSVTVGEEVAVAPKLEDNLIRFPYVSSTATAPAVPSKSSEGPEWRQLIRDRVRESREKRSTEGGTVEAVEGSSAVRDVRALENTRPVSNPGESVSDRTDVNPIVESALKRIRRVPSPVTPLPVAGRVSGSPATALKSNAIEEPVDGKDRSQVSSAPVPPPTTKRTTTGSTRSGSQAVGSPTGTSAKVETTPSGRLRERIRTRGSERQVSGVNSRPEPKPTPKVETVTAPLPVRPSPKPERVEVGSPALPSDTSGTETEPRVMAAEAGVEKVAPAGPLSRTLRITRRLKLPPKLIDTQIIEVPRVFRSATSKRGEPASFWVRTLAGGCDFEIVSLSFLPVFAAYAGLNTVLEAETLVVMLVLFSLLTFFYHGVTLSLAGRTYGMAMLNLRLISIESEPDKVSRRQLILRAWASTIASLLPPLNLLVRILNERHLSLPDLVSGTLPVED